MENKFIWIIVFSCLFFVQNIVFADPVKGINMPIKAISGTKSKYAVELSKMEKSIFNMTYDQQTDDIRLKRIEENIYGSTSTKPIEIRISRLSKDLSTNLIGHEIKPKRDSFLADDEIIMEKPNEDMNFSIVNNLEKKVFQHEFKALDIANRLSALEVQVFKKCYSTDDVSTRINRLQGAVFYNRILAEGDKIEPMPKLCKSPLIIEKAKEDKINPATNFSLKEQKMDSDSHIRLVSLEKALFSKVFSKERNSDRLARLETSVFQSTFPEDDSETRLHRIEGAQDAQRSIKKYKDNKAYKQVTTAVEIGTIILLILPLLL